MNTTFVLLLAKQVPSGIRFHLPNIAPAYHATYHYLSKGATREFHYWRVIGSLQHTLRKQIQVHGIELEEGVLPDGFLLSDPSHITNLVYYPLSGDMPINLTWLNR
jgi:hypothetical protein